MLGTTAHADPVVVELSDVKTLNIVHEPVPMQTPVGVSSSGKKTGMTKLIP